MGDPPAMPQESHLPSPLGVEVEVYASGLEIVWGLEFAPDGRLFLTERPGRIRVVSPGGRLEPRPWKTLDNVYHRQESGLLGLALHPEFPEEPWVYVMYTARTENGIENRISRIREEDDRGAGEEVLFDGLAARGNHSGGRIRFGPDGMLYVGTGEAFERRRAQDLEDPAGSILRLTPEGRIPDDNPWAGNPAWAYGLRNVHGLTWHPETGRMFAADHGPSGEGGVRHRDRILVIEPGENYGWPEVVGAAGVPEYEDPILVFIPAAPPGDLLFYDGELMPDFHGDLFFSVLGFGPRGAQTLMRIRFQDADDPTRPTGIERWFNDEEGNAVYGRLRGMTVGPDGALYVGTSNRDGRERAVGPREGDDRILRILPADR